jgi:hypothetical protein
VSVPAAQYVPSSHSPSFVYGQPAAAAWQPQSVASVPASLRGE